MQAIHRATLEDLSFFEELEKSSFDPSRQFNHNGLRRSILSPHQAVYVLTIDGQKVAGAIVHCHKKTWRLYSIAVLPTFRHLKLGRALLDHIIKQAKVNHIFHITLEADAQESKLLKWYASFGFKFVKVLPDFYGPHQDGHKMIKKLREQNHRLANVVVIDQPADWLKSLPNISVISAEEFINDSKYQTDEYRIFNLCSSYAYQTLGYYVSLLASAREIRAIPNVATIEDFTDSTIVESIGEEVADVIERTLRSTRSNTFTLRVLFGKSLTKRYAELGKALYKLFEAPFLEFSFVRNRKWRLIKVEPLPVQSVPVTDFLLHTAKRYFAQKRFTNPRLKNYKYDLAILIDPKEPAPPSGQTALAKFQQAAEKIGFYTEFITKEDYHRVTQFDALFIRATTNVNDYTYQFSRYAYSEGLVVIDDPWAILKCSNKLYLHESMKAQGILTPKTLLISAKTPIAEILANFSFPIVLKRPDSASSLGVFKVSDEKALKEKLEQLFVNSELVLAQEYIKSAFDWRVGILDNKPLYVCKYFMAKNHWQIYNWNPSKSDYKTGPVETLLVEDAPREVVETALEAAAPMGDGFFGVDLKESNGKIYVIEVNDNPSIDRHWEDQILGDELYLKIMRNFLERIEKARNIKRIIPFK